MKKIIQLKITLSQTDPSIWRRVQVSASVSFFDLHHIIQIAMGWTNSHLFEFLYDDYRFGWTGYDYELPENTVDASDVILSKIVTNQGEKLKYI